MNLDPAQAVDLEPDQIATATSSDSNRLLVELTFATPGQAQEAHNQIRDRSRGVGLQLNILPLGINHGHAQPRLRPMPMPT